MQLSRPSWAIFNPVYLRWLRRRFRIFLADFWHGVLGIAYSMILPALIVVVVATVLGLALLFLRLLP